MKMEIPITFYFRFWLINTAMATATGFVVGYMLMSLFPFLLPVITVPVIAFIVYQCAILRYFWGRGRGFFEYAYNEWLLRKATNRFFRKALGIREYLRLRGDELNTTGSSRGDIYKRLRESAEVTERQDHRFFLNVRIAESSLKEACSKRELEYLRKAVAIRPHDLVANCRLGNSLERDGDGHGAIQSYKAALEDPETHTNELKEHILAQIIRIEAEGPAKRPPMPGLRFMSY